MTDFLETGYLLPGPRYQEGKSINVRSILSDVDNTIVSNESLDLPTARVSQAFFQAGERVLTGLATARPFQKFEHLARHLQLTGKSILSNGAQIFDGKKGVMVVERPLGLETVMDIARMLQANGMEHWIQDAGIDHLWVTKGQATRQAKATSEGLGLYRHLQDLLKPEKGFVDVASYVPHKPFIIVVHKVVAADLFRIQEMIKGYKDEKVTAFVAHEHKDEKGSTFDVFITDKKTNKREALLEIEQMEKIPLTEFLTIGDGHNDKVLIESAGVGVAMGNAVDPVKQVAVFIAPDQEHDGAAVALEALVLKKVS
jgi:HAD superfamily hydrolase (TIGR01484 family)